jgi:hypothetical protein
VKNFADFTHGGYEVAIAHAKADATPGLQHFLLRWQASGINSTALINSSQKLERCLQVRHAAFASLL